MKVQLVYSSTGLHLACLRKMGPFSATLSLYSDNSKKTIGPCNGQRARLLIQRSKFKSHSSLHFSVKFSLKRTTINKKRPFQTCLKTIYDNCFRIGILYSWKCHSVKFVTSTWPFFLFQDDDTNWKNVLLLESQGTRNRHLQVTIPASSLFGKIFFDLKLGHFLMKS